jgi:hypothetical protein
MFPLRLPAQFCKDSGDADVLEIAQYAFDYAHSISQHQGQPIAIAGFAILKSDAAEHAAQGRRRRRCPECRGDVWSLVGMQDLNSDRLLQRTLPAVALVDFLVEGFTGITSAEYTLYTGSVSRESWRRREPGEEEKKG